MPKFLTWLVIIAALVGVYFLGRGITGLVVSETCCVGNGCSPVNTCDYAKTPILESPMRVADSFTNMLMGAGILGLLLLVVFGVRRLRK